VEEIRYLRSELSRVLPNAAGAPPLAWTAGLRPLLATPGQVSAASREHRIVDDGPLLTVVGGKYTTFRVMARDAILALERKFQRQGPPLRDPTEPLPRLPGAEVGVEALALAAADSGFARRIEDVLRRRSSLWLTPDRGRVAAPAVGAVLARRLGWSPEHTRAELQECYSVLESEDRLLQVSREVA
jgi:glycerol-3-phosphate dehydrogenase